jgi:TfoX/Sxy family transcriptional regulator of competence genes
MMKWEKAPQETIDLFHRIAPEGHGIVSRSMFDYPCRFLNGNMFIGVFQDKIILRLGEQDRKTFFQEYNSSPLEPMPGRPMKEYVVLPQKILDSKALLESWVSKSFAYASRLPAKHSSKH